jgi:hypothetical protein
VRTWIAIESIIPAVASRVTVTAPDGRRWVVTRRWWRRPRWRDAGWSDLESWLGIGDVSLEGIAVGLTLAIVFAILIVLFLPLILFALDAVFVAAGAYALGFPWRVTAATAGPPSETLSWGVRGWWRSRRAVREVARELGAGVRAEPEDAEP